MPSVLDVHDEALSALRRAAIVALEALEVGDQELAVEVLLGALERDGRNARPWACPHCRGLAYEWPGLFEQHLLVVHGEGLSRAA